MMTTMGEPQLHEWMQYRVAERLNVSIDHIDVNVPLMTLGLDSLSLVELAGLLAELLGRDVSADVLWEHDSIALLSKHFGQDLDDSAESLAFRPQDADYSANSYLSAAGQWSGVRVLQANGSRPPLFLAQGVAGGISEYRALAAALGDNQPTFGLHCPPDQGDSIEAIASALMDGLRSVQRKGPYYLGGYCFGGILAREVAVRLINVGERVELLAMFDVPYPSYQEKYSLREYLSAYRRRAVSFVEAPIYLARELMQDRNEFAGRIQRQVSRLTHRMKRRLGITETSNVDKFTTLFFASSERARVHVTAMKTYRPSPYPGSLMYFQSREFKALHAMHNWKWSRMAAGTFEEIILPCEHRDVMDNSAVQVIARAIGARISSASLSNAT